MQKRALGSTGLNVSQIGFGALEIGRDWAPDVNSDPSHPDEKEAAHVLNGILDLGINFIDTAPAYWHSEEFIGKAISHRRTEFILATKVGEHCDPEGSIYDYSGNACVQFIENSLRKLKTDHIDLLQIHSASVEVLERGEVLEAMLRAKQQGKVRFVGMTGGVRECLRAIELGGYETVQFPYNLLTLDSEERLLSLAREKGIGVIIMRGLAGGKLTSKFENLKDEELREKIRGLVPFTGEGTSAEDIAHLAIQYILAEQAVSTIILGTRRLERVRENLARAAKPIPTDLIERVREYARELV